MALAAVALQDHMTRSLSLQDPFKEKKMNHSLPAAARNKKTNRAAVNTCKKGDDREEYVLDPKPAPLTLGMFLLHNCNSIVIIMEFLESVTIGLQCVQSTR